MQKQQVLFSNKGSIIFLLTLPLFISGVFFLGNDEGSFLYTIGVSIVLTSTTIMGIMIGLLWRYEDPKFGNSLFKLEEKNANA